MNEECDCKNLKNGSIIKTDKDGFCVVCGRNWNMTTNNKETVDVYIKEAAEEAILNCKQILITQLQKEVEERIGFYLGGTKHTPLR